MVARLLWVIFYTILALILLAFMAMNRATVSVRILPFVDRMEMPLFVALSAVFMFGLLIGLSFAAIHSLTTAQRNRRQSRAIIELEKELANKTTKE